MSMDLFLQLSANGLVLSSKLLSLAHAVRRDTDAVICRLRFRLGPALVRHDA